MKKKYKIITAVIILLILILFFFKCSSIGISDSDGADGAAGGAVDTTPIPANSEFLEE